MFPTGNLSRCINASFSQHSKVILLRARIYVDVKPVVTIGASMDIHCTCYGERLLFEEGLLLYTMLYFKEATLRGRY